MLADFTNLFDSRKSFHRDVLAGPPTFVRVHQHVHQIDGVARVVHGHPQHGAHVVELPEHGPPHHKHQVVEHGQGHDRQPLEFTHSSHYNNGQIHVTLEDMGASGFKQITYHVVC